MQYAPSSQQPAARRFRLVLIKPTHYCDDGYPITWHRNAVPSNSLACVFGIAKAIDERRALGDDIGLEIHAVDEANTSIRPERIASEIQAAGAGMVMLIGVQSNQMPRALDIARPLRAQGIQVAIGGFHVSGVIAMIDGDDPYLREAQAMGLSVFAGEAEGEGRLDGVLRDALAGQLKPLYNFMNDLPGIDGAPIPFLKRERIKRTAGSVTGFDAGRGCPYQCSFCTIINVQGRKSRRRTPDDIEKIIRANVAQGLHRFFISDDNFARNKDWEIILDRIIYLREAEKMKLSFFIQVDTLCHRLPNFIAKCKRAGVNRVYIGMENINPENLMAAKKKQNKITEYRRLFLEWQKAGALIYAGVITGFPGETAESVLRDIDIIKKELPIDVLEIFFLTPLPGSEDHQKMFRAGIWMDPDLNKYDLYHITTEHPKMSEAEWTYAYAEAWRRFYSLDHCATIMRRAASLQRSFSKTLFAVTWFKGTIEIEGVHPVEGGFLRIKDRRNRRPTLPIEPVWKFYPRYWTELAVKTARWLWLYVRLRIVYDSIKRDPKRYEYTDLAITPLTDDEIETHEMFHTEAGQQFVAQEQRLEKIRRGVAA
jgi:hypothetical protein